MKVLPTHDYPELTARPSAPNFKALRRIGYCLALSVAICLGIAVLLIARMPNTRHIVTIQHRACAGAVSGEVAMAEMLIGVNALSIRLSIKKGTRCNWCCLRRTPFIKAGRSLRFDAEEVIQPLPHSEKSERV
jgi:hypothetical protein